MYVNVCMTNINVDIVRELRLSGRVEEAQRLINIHYNTKEAMKRALKRQYRNEDSRYYQRNKRMSKKNTNK